MDLLTLIFLAGCIPEPVTGPVAMATLTSTGRAATANGSNLITIRTFKDVGINRVWTEDRVGVSCTVRHPYYSAQFTAPARVQVPVFPGVSQKFEAICTDEGKTATRSNACYYGGGEQGSFTDPATGECLRSNLSVIFGK